MCGWTCRTARSRPCPGPSSSANRNPLESPQPRGRLEHGVVLLRLDHERLVSDQVDEVEVVVAGALGQAEHAEPAAVRREAGDLAVAARREHASLLAAHERAHVHVQVASVAPVARVRERRAVDAQARRDVEELGLDDERLGRGTGRRDRGGTAAHARCRLRRLRRGCARCRGRTTRWRAPRGR